MNDWRDALLESGNAFAKVSEAILDLLKPCLNGIQAFYDVIDALVLEIVGAKNGDN